MTTQRTRRFAAIGLAASLSLGLLASACGEPAASAPPATPAPTASGALATPTAAAVPTVWSDSMPKEQQIAFMKTNVLPAMSPVFKAHDASRYADFGCGTCHGPAYKDPHEFLPHLTVKDGNLTAFAEKPAVAKFMAESVTPKMAAAMGLPHYDPATKQGFGCGGCHTIDMK